MRAHGRVLHPGAASGEVLRLETPLSLWGGFDPVSGMIIDRAHPQVGEMLAGRVVVMPGSRGSSGTPGVLAESIRRGTGPAALVVTKADINLIAGVLVAGALYGSSCPVVLVDRSAFDLVQNAVAMTVEIDGTLTQVTPRAPWSGRR